MKRGIFRRIFILFPVLLVLSVLFVEFYVTSVVRESHIESLKERLVVEAGLVSGDMNALPREAVQGLAADLKEQLGVRVTVIAEDGTVIGDSDKDPAVMDDHLGRPEIQDALFSGKGYSIRYSGTLGQEFLYAAVRAPGADGPGRFVRLSRPLQDVNSEINELRLKILSAVLLAFLLTSGIYLWQTGRMRRLVVQLTDFSRALAGGDLKQRLLFDDKGEFGEIARNLNAMSLELKGMVQQSEEEKNQLGVILKSIPDALLIIDSKGTVTLSSSASREAFGLETPLGGRPFYEVVRNHEFCGMMEEAMKTHEPRSGEIRLDYPVERHFMVRISPLPYRGEELSGFVAVFHDTTRMKKLEEVRKDFVANVSHELKTPITAIKGFADTLLEGAVEDRDNALKFIATIKSHSERINSLVDDLMTISKVEMGVLGIEKSALKIEDVIDNVFSILGDRASGKKLELGTAVRPGCGELDADRNRLTQILTNLVDNAIKFTERGRVTVGVDREDGRRFIFVEDTGAGVEKKHLGRLGERFYRVDASRSRELGGTGLGLAIVKHLVKAHGWEMKFESEYGRGTRVKIFVS